jgi:nicotinamide-nucleotide amidase
VRPPDELLALVEQAHAELRRRGATVAVAESLTGGLLCAALTEVAGASSVVRGGVVAYATPLKAQLLDVPGDLLASSGPVDPDVAAAMAAGVRARLAAAYGVATTGVAGPSPQDGAPVGAVYVAVAAPDGVRVEGHRFAGDRAAIRAAATTAALELLVAALTARPA